MIEINVGPASFTLPLSDEALCRLDPEDKLQLFLPLERAKCESVAGIPELTQKLPRQVRVDEMNMLAYILQQCDEHQLQKLRESVRPFSHISPGELLKHALAVCPEAAGFQKDSGLCPLYTGENIYDLMEYKRYRDWKREYPEFQIAKFYIPMDVLLRPTDGGEDIDLDRGEASHYRGAISDMLARHLRCYDEWSDLTTHHFLLTSFENRDLGLLFERPDVEVRDGELWCVVVAGLKHALTEQEREFLQIYIDGGVSDAWGEDIPWAQSPDGALHLFLFEGTEVREQAGGELTLTGQQEFQLQAPRNMERLLNTTGFTPDFKDKWEYGKQQPIWLELSADRKTVRVPLPATADELENARGQIGNVLIHYRLQAPHKPLLENGLEEGFDLEELNTLAKYVRTQPADIMEQAVDLLYSRELPGSDGIVTAFLQALEEIVSQPTDKVCQGLDNPSM